MSIPSPTAGKWTAVLESAPRLCEIIAVENEPSAEHALIGRCVFMALVQHLLRWVTARRLTACLLLVVSVGMLFPLSYQSGESPSEKDQSAPFPCQNRPCGCKTAEQCWKKCCCKSKAIAGKSDQTAEKPNEGGLTLSLDTLRCSGIDTSM